MFIFWGIVIGAVAVAAAVVLAELWCDQYHELCELREQRNDE